ncbi:MAG: hypothetical protein ACK5LP_02135 [Campylobacteraceae bacterium]
MKLLEEWLEHDYNPFIVFDLNGKVMMINQEAQYLLSQTTAKEIFSIANTYANVTYGFKTTLVDLSFGTISFYGVTVGYLDNENIGIKLYKTTVRRFSNINEVGEKINIYSLLDLCISASSVHRSTTFKKDFDPTFPELKIKIDDFTKLVGKVFESHTDTNHIIVKLAIKTGEYIKFNNKKYAIFYISVEGGIRDTRKELDIEKLSQNINAIVQFLHNQTILSLPMIY